MIISSVLKSELLEGNSELQLTVLDPKTLLIPSLFRKTVLRRRIERNLFNQSKVAINVRRKT